MTSHLYIPGNQHFTQTLAATIVEQCAADLPDLTSVHIFIPNALAAHQLRQQLIKASPGALIGPYIGNLQQWVENNIALQQAQATPINQQTRRLILLDALAKHTSIFQAENIWQVCDSLLSLFDELTESDCGRLISNEDDWKTHLQQAYGAEINSENLNQEANIIYTLWQAWQTQLNQLNIIDSSNAYHQRLSQLDDAIDSNYQFYIIGAEQLSPIETVWCKHIETHHLVHYVVQGHDHEASVITDPVEQIFNLQYTLQQRCAQPAISSALPTLSIFDAKHAEQEAVAVKLQAHRCLLAGYNNIGIVTEDRKLGRRIRALLDRNNISVQDTAGWSLSTTSAAACVERWLECIEEDFAYEPLLDLLKSPFFIDDEQRQQHLNIVYRFEQDIVYHENISGDILRYQQALRHRKQRLHTWTADTSIGIDTLLQALNINAEPLIALYKSNSQAPAREYLAALINSLQSLGIYQRLQNDKAGIGIVKILNTLLQSAEVIQPMMGWADFRHWLASTMEQEQFTPHNEPASVQLMNMQQAQYCHFDALIIAGANKNSLPGSSIQSAFFNQNVKQFLGLKHWKQEKDYRFYMFKNLLQCANEVLITYKSEQDGEWLAASPWVSTLIDYYRLVFDQDLHNHQLHEIISQFIAPEQNNARHQNIPDKHPGTALDPQLTPVDYSASRYQRMINCPYQFFAADGLSLKAEEMISDELQKSEYGEKVHLILQAFHQAVNNLPAPFNSPVTPENRQQAVDHITNLSIKVFQQNIEDNVQHRSWLKRWLDNIESYIDWLMERQQQWSIFQLEQRLSSAIDDETSIIGRLDRIDQANNEYSIIDYKTGTTPSQAKVNQGEDVQLASYASLLDQVTEVAYLKLDKQQTKIAARLDGDRLDELKQKNQQRLKTIIDKIKQGQELKAWGDKDVCMYCDMEGLCRKQIWENS